MIRHYDITGKDCPKYFVENEAAWETFRSDVGAVLADMPKEEKFLKQELKNAYEKVSTGTELRAGLIEMKNLLKEEKNRRELAYQLGGDFKILTRCLSDEDPKVRKNAALVLGAMESDDLVPVLLNAYKKEDTLFVKSAYLKALFDLDYEEELPYLKGCPCRSWMRPP